MKYYMKLILTGSLLLAFIWSVFSWFESEKEIRILSIMTGPGHTGEQVIKALNTGKYLRFKTTKNTDTQHIFVSSIYDMGNMTNTITLRNGIVISNDFKKRIDLSKLAAWIAFTGFIGMSLFQLFLSLGAPFGKFAWGGRYPLKLPFHLRVGSAITTIIYIMGIMAVFVSTKIIHSEYLYTPAGIVVSILSLLFLLSALGNSLSRSIPERKTMTPIALVLSALCFIIAFGHW